MAPQSTIEPVMDLPVFEFHSASDKSTATHSGPKSATYHVREITPPTHNRKEEREVGKKQEARHKNEDNKSLEDLLYDKGVRHFKDGQYWPKTILDRIMTYERVLVQLKLDLSSLTSSEDISELANNIITYCPRVFAILVMCSRGKDIGKFMKYGLIDSRLPLISQEKRCLLFWNTSAQPPVPCNIFDECKWSSFERRGFDTMQHQLDPVFLHMPSDRKVGRRMLKNEQILPFESRIDEQDKRGGFGVVKRVRIDPYSHDFKDILRSIKTDDEFAWKELRRDNTKVSLEAHEADFKKEIENLRKFNGFEHPHLVTLLAAWTQEGEPGHDACHNLLFPMARYDLDLYWDDDPNPNIQDRGTAQWISGQVRGLISAVQSIHYPRSNQLLPPGHRDEKFGRHGDLKPQNILFFDSLENDRGIWVIADLGLTAFNSSFSRSNFPNTELICTPKYKSPECDCEGGTISRSYDIWTLGCVLLELVIWALMGGKKRKEFLTELWAPYLTGSQSDKFFDIKLSENRKGYVVLVKPQVNDWIALLHRSENCTEYFHELLDLIEQKMLITLAAEPKRVRIDSTILLKKIDSMHKQVMGHDSKYALYPQPRRLRRPIYDDPVEAKFRGVTLQEIENLKLESKLETHRGASQRSFNAQQLSKMDRIVQEYIPTE